MKRNGLMSGAKGPMGFISIRDHRLPRLRKLEDAEDKGFESELKSASGDLRILIERSGALRSC